MGTAASSEEVALVEAQLQQRPQRPRGLSSNERWELHGVYQRIDTSGHGWFFKQEFVGAIMMDDVVHNYMFPAVAEDRFSDDRSIELAEEAWATISQGRRLISYPDLASFFLSEAMLVRQFEQLGGHRGGQVSKVKFTASVVNNPTLFTQICPWIDGSAAMDSGPKTKEAEAVFDSMAEGRPYITFEHLARYLQQGQQLKNIFSRMDLDGSGSVSKLELIGAVATDEVVARFVLPGFETSDLGRSQPNQRKILAAEQKFEIIACGKKRITYGDLEAHFTRAKAAGTGLLAMDSVPMNRALVPSAGPGRPMHEEQLALVPASTDLVLAGPAPAVRRPKEWWRPTRYSDEILKLTDLTEHPLESDMVKIADQEVRLAIWGPVPENTKILYEFQYNHFPYFCVVVSAIQLAAYLLTVDTKLTLTGPPSNPPEFWMQVYNQNCDDLRHEIWRLWTYQWVHANLTHVAGNVIGNLFIGGMLEAVHGSWNVGLLYSWGVLSGGLTMGTFQPHMAVVGSSGGVYTMIGARVSNLILNKENMPQTFWCRAFFLIGYCIMDTMNFFLAYHAGTSYSAHAGGWLCGLLYGASWLVNLEERRWEIKLILWFRRIFLLYVLFCVAWYATQPAGEPQGVFDSAGRCAFSSN